MNQRHSGSVAIVTGAAGGMGAPAAALLAQQGWPLILCDVDASRLEDVAAPIRAAGGRVENLSGDIADPAYLDRLIATIGDRPIGALIHTAGISPSMADADRIIDVNIVATVRLVDATRARMAEGACAVLIASMSAHMIGSLDVDGPLDATSAGGDATVWRDIVPDAGMAYAISKLAVVRLVQREATAYGERDARIVSISPGLIDTSLGRAEMIASPAMNNVLALTPLRRLGLGTEIASVAVLLCSADASYVTGCDIRVDGGSSAILDQVGFG